MNTRVSDYIKAHWLDTVKFNPEDEGTLIGLPYQYTVPAVGHFDEMYYWDTFFTNKGLILSGRASQALNNTDDIIYLVKCFGFMPNGNRLEYLSRSQPPFLSYMVRDVYGIYKNTDWLKKAYDALEKEYSFWQTRRSTKCGLNRYFGEVRPHEYNNLAKCFEDRCGYKPDSSVKNTALHVITTCESGWDINPRWDFDGFNFAPVDLNSLMYGLEKNMEFFAFELKNGEENAWGEKASIRKKLMLKYMNDGSGVLLDYNFKTKARGKVFSVASFFPMFAGLSDMEHAEATMKRLPELEAEYGILTCVENDTPGTYQWDYPNGWACLQYIAVMAMEQYGYREDALRIADKFVRLVEKVFDETNNLWEKYNVVEGNINVTNEYVMPPMMGWTAGVYLALQKYVSQYGKTTE